MRFLYVVAVILSLSFAFTMIVADRCELSLSDQMLFLGLTVAGPFAALGPLFWGPGPLTFPILVAAYVVCLTTFCYLIRPNNVSLFISMVGAVAWTMVAPLLVVILPELGIRI